MSTVARITNRDINRSQELQDRIIQLWECPVEFGRLWHNGVIEPDGTRRKEYSRIHKQIADHALSSDRTSTIISRNHGKTTFFGDLALWEKWHNINDTFMYCSAGTDLAIAILSDLRGITESTQPLPLLPDGSVTATFGEMFPELLPVRPPGKPPPGSFNCAGRTIPLKEPCFFAKSPGASKAGLHPHRIYVDDASNERNSTTPVQRQKVIDFIKQLTPILRSQVSGAIRIIGTPWAFQDVSDYLKRNESFSQLRFGCWDGVNPDTGLRDGQGPGPDGAWPLCPSFMTAEELYAQELETDDYEFWAQQYLCTPVAAANSLFDDALIATTTHRVADHQALPPGKNILLWDPTSRADAQVGDWNGIVLVRATTAEQVVELCKRNPAYAIPGLAEMAPATNIFFVAEALELRGPPADCMPVVRKIHEKWGIDQLWVEDTGAASWVQNWVDDHHWARGIATIPIKLGSRGASKDRRLQGTQFALKEGRLRFISSAPGYDILTQRLTEFPKSESDDLPDALALLTWRGQRKGILPKITIEPDPNSYYNAAADPTSLAFRQPPPPSSW